MFIVLLMWRICAENVHTLQKVFQLQGLFINCGFVLIRCSRYCLNIKLIYSYYDTSMAELEIDRKDVHDRRNGERML